MIRATKFHTLESEGTAGPSRSTQLGNPFLQVPTDPTTRGGSGLRYTAAADLVFYFLCVLIFAGTPLAMVLL